MAEYAIVTVCEQKLDQWENACNWKLNQMFKYPQGLCTYMDFIFSLKRKRCNPKLCTDLIYTRHFCGKDISNTTKQKLIIKQNPMYI